MFADRVLSGMRPTGKLHLGHYHGVIKNWITLQREHECLFMVADWHALTTNYDEVGIIEKSIWDMVIDWLAAGVDPEQATIFIQSKVPQHAELHLALSMVTPLGWLERVPTYKDQIDKLSHKDLTTYGFLGYPLLQAADILVYKAGRVPVGEDQVPHIELTREVARRFNHLYGREPNFEELAKAAVKKMGKVGKEFEQLRVRYLQDGDGEALLTARALLAASQNLGAVYGERLLGYLENKGKIILPEAEALL
ncbi:MAG: tryptophan--tRNA ligase, partial [Pseudogulbenkiania sp.]|nr:tryptophan--tRNA ligase [Pseudogulbenkiania sp.]